MTARRDDIATAEAALEAGLARVETLRSDLASGPGWLAVGDPARLAAAADRQQAEAALAVRAELQSTWAAIAAIEAELDALDGERPHDIFVFLEFSRWLGSVADADQLLGELVPDPRRALLGTPPRMLRATAERIVAAVAANGGHVGDGDAFVAAAGLSDDDVWDLYATGRARLDPPVPGQAVGTLLPLRLETRFRRPTPPGPGGEPARGWRLQIRVEPDPISLAAEPVPVTADEASAVATCWTRCSGALDGPDGAAAFAALAGQVSPERAAYLLRTVAVVPDGDGGFAPETDYPSRPGDPSPPVVGLPAELHVWGDDGHGLRLLATLEPDREAIAATTVLDAVTPLADGTVPPTWWTSFAKAAEVKLATEIELGTEAELGGLEPRFDVLLVTGLGDDPPGRLLAGHADGGALACVAVLSPTNTIAGQPAADLGRDPAGWLAVGRSPWGTAGSVLGALAGSSPDHGAAIVQGLPEPDLRRHRAADLLVRALWPVFWQRSLKDVAGLGAQVWTLGRWAGRLLAPFGPHPAIRIGDLPYGVLPVTDLTAWRWRDGDPVVERGLPAALLPLVKVLGDAATAQGTAAGAGAGELLDVLARVPTSRELGVRQVLPVPLLAALHAAFGTGVSAADVVDAWTRSTEVPRDLLPDRPLRMNMPFGAVRPLPRKVGPAPAPYLKAYLETSWEQLAFTGDLDARWEVEGLAPPVVARLVRHALLLTQAEVSRLDVESWPSWQPPLLLPPDDARELAALAARGRRVRDLPDYAVALVDTASPDPRAVDVIRQFVEVREAVERLAGVEPEVLAQVLPAVVDTAGHRVDAWATGLANRRLRRLLARGAEWRLGAYGWVDDLRPAEDPTPPTAAGLLHAPGYAQALTAAVLRDHAVHDGADPRWRITVESRSARVAAALAEDVRAGAHLSEAVGREIERRVAEPARVLELRVDFPARPEWAGRRVCDGLAVLAAAAAQPPPWLPARPTLPAWLDPASIADLQGALDTYADLLVADAVHDVVDGRAAAAQASMEAAAGLGAPPELGVLRTRREGSTVRTSVLAVLPWMGPDPATPSPVALADPAVAAAVENECGPATGWTWTDGAGSVSLDQLGLAVADVLVIHEASLAAAAAAALGSAPIGGTASGLLRRAAALCSLLGAQSGSPWSASLPGTSEDPAAISLRERLGLVRAAAETMLLALRTDPPAPVGTDPSALAAARRWGLLGVGAEVEASAAADALTARLAEAGSAVDDAHADAAVLAARLRALVPPVFGLPLICPSAVAGLQPAPSGPDGSPRLDAEWLEVIAAVRPAMARLEAHQLGAGVPTWAAAVSTGAPIWSIQPDAPATSLVVAYGPPDAVATVTAGGQVGLALLDAWAETVPSRRHTTWAAFGFDAPRARAPQALLLAVPPDESVPLAPDDLPGIALQARALARARASGPVWPDGASGGLPLPLALASGPAAVDLTGEPP